MGFSHSKKHREEKRQLACKVSEQTDFEQLMQANEDAEIYDSDVDNEADQLEIAINWEKNLQVRQKVEHRRATEKRDKWTIVSRQERTEAYLALADQLTFSEKQNWLEYHRKLDSAQGF